MFGTLRPQPCRLDEDTRADYRRLYCGTCKGIGAHFGLAHRATLTWDVVLLGAAIEALLHDASDPSSCRCPLNPLSHRPILAPESVSMQVASAVQILLTDQWVADQHRDGSSLASWVRPLTSAPTAHAAQRLRDLGLDPTPLTALDHHQAVVEREGPDIVRAAEPTADAIGALFAQLPRLPGTVQADPQALRQLGHGVGAAIYTIDALEDLEKDLRSADFNPCITADGRIDGEQVEACVCLLLDGVSRIAHAIDVLPLQRHRALLHHVLVDQLPRRADRAVTGARDAVFEQWQALSGRKGTLEELEEPEPEKTPREKSGHSCCICDCGPISGVPCADACCGACECATCCDAGCCCV